MNGEVAKIKEEIAAEYEKARFCRVREQPGSFEYDDYHEGQAVGLHRALVILGLEDKL